MPDMRNRFRGDRWRELVALALQVAGIETASARPTLPKGQRHRVFEEGGLKPDIRGVPGVHLNAGAIQLERLGSYLDSTASGAGLAGDDSIPALCVYRQNRPVAEAYTILTLGDFARLVQRAQEAPQEPQDRPGSIEG